MKLLSYSINNKEDVRLGVLIDNKIIDAELGLFALTDNSELSSFPNTMISLLQDWNKNKVLLEKLEEKLGNESLRSLKSNEDSIAFELSEIQFQSPVPVPNSFRDFYAFEQHVKSARKLRNLEVVKEWYDFPVFYFSNSNAFYGHNDSIPKPRYTNELDFELEVACIISKEGKNIKLEEASNYIAGFSILNDWSARDVQRE